MISKKRAEIDSMRPYDLLEKVKLLRKRDGRKFYKLNNGLFIDVSCVACSGNGFTFNFNKFGFRHVECSRCRTLYVSPRPKEAHLIEYYSEFRAPAFWTVVLLKTDSKRKVLQYKPRAKMLIDVYRRNTSKENSIFLDVGSGTGNFALSVKNERYFHRVITLDVSRSCKETCEKKGLEAFLGTLYEYKEKVDCITMNDLIEHVYSPQSLLREASRMLNRGGVLMIATPNWLGFDFLLFGKDTDNVTPPEHIQYFNPKSISVLLERSGFSILDILTPGILDVQIVERRIKDGHAIKHNNFIKEIIDSDNSTKQDFQTFLQKHKLSSHMVVFAKKID